MSTINIMKIVLILDRCHVESAEFESQINYLISFKISILQLSR